MIFNFVENISPYLTDTPHIVVARRRTPINTVPAMRSGNKTIDGGHYLFTEKERDEFIKKEPLSQKLFKTWVGANELLNRHKRYCLYAKDCDPQKLSKMPLVLNRIKLVEAYRLKSKSIPTQKLAEYPLNFHVTNTPRSSYLLIPVVSSERRAYIPMKFLDKSELPGMGTLSVENATLYHFGVLTSSVHMAWIKEINRTYSLV